MDQLSFEIKKGEIFGFLGPSGAGKSTTQKILIGLLKGYSGGVRLFGNDLDSYDEDLYNRVGVAFEQPDHYLKLTGRENLEFYRSLYDRKTREIEPLLKLVGLTESADVLVSNYSKGMKVRLNFARSLLHFPELLFLDEPTTGLDPVNTKKVIDIIRELKSGGVTVFLTTHNMFVADELCDRVAFIVDGAISKTAPPKELKLTYGQKVVSVEYTNGSGKTGSSDFPMEDLGENTEFLTLLNEYEVQTIHSQEATLDSVFQIVTGRNLR